MLRSFQIDVLAPEVMAVVGTGDGRMIGTRVTAALLLAFLSSWHVLDTLTRSIVARPFLFPEWSRPLVQRKWSDGQHETWGMPVTDHSPFSLLRRKSDGRYTSAIYEWSTNT